MNYIGIDYGTKVIGLSWGSDELGMAVPLKAILRFVNISQVFEQIRSVVFEKGCDCFVVGLPLHIDGTEGKRVEEVKYFSKKLEDAFGKPVLLQDERFSTQAAQYLSGYESMSLKKTKKQKTKGVIDSRAATIILQDFLDALPTK